MELKIGDKVHYIPFKNCDSSAYENGLVKDIEQQNLGFVRIVYHCAGDWENFKRYSSARTEIEHLREGWSSREEGGSNEL